MDFAPPAMVRTQLLAEKVAGAVGDGVESALLLSTTGALLCSASSRQNFAQSQECRMLIALVSNLWRTYSQSASGYPAATNSFENQHHYQGQQNINTDLDFAFVELENYKLGCFCIGNNEAVLALQTRNLETELGALKLKANSLNASLSAALLTTTKQQQLQMQIQQQQNLVAAGEGSGSNYNSPSRSMLEES